MSKIVNTLNNHTSLATTSSEVTIANQSMHSQTQSTKSLKAKKSLAVAKDQSSCLQVNSDTTTSNQNYKTKFKLNSQTNPKLSVSKAKTTNAQTNTTSHPTLDNNQLVDDTEIFNFNLDSYKDFCTLKQSNSKLKLSKTSHNLEIDPYDHYHDFDYSNLDHDCNSTNKLATTSLVNSQTNSETTNISGQAIGQLEKLEAHASNSYNYSKELNSNQSSLDLYVAHSYDDLTLNSYDNLTETTKTVSSYNTLAQSNTHGYNYQDTVSLLQADNSPTLDLPVSDKLQALIKQKIAKKRKQSQSTTSSLSTNTKESIESVEPTYGAITNSGATATIGQYDLDPLDIISDYFGQAQELNSHDLEATTCLLHLKYQDGEISRDTAQELFEDCCQQTNSQSSTNTNHTQSQLKESDDDHLVQSTKKLLNNIFGTPKDKYKATAKSASKSATKSATLNKTKASKLSKDLESVLVSNSYNTNTTIKTTNTYKTLVNTTKANSTKTTIEPTITIVSKDSVTVVAANNEIVQTVDNKSTNFINSNHNTKTINTIKSTKNIKAKLDNANTTANSKTTNSKTVTSKTITSNSSLANSSITSPTNTTIKPNTTQSSTRLGFTTTQTSIVPKTSPSNRVFGDSPGQVINKALIHLALKDYHSSQYHLNLVPNTDSSPELKLNKQQFIGNQYTPTALLKSVVSRAVLNSSLPSSQTLAQHTLETTASNHNQHNSRKYHNPFTQYHLLSCEDKRNYLRNELIFKIREQRAIALEAKLSHQLDLLDFSNLIAKTSTTTPSHAEQSSDLIIELDPQDLENNSVNQTTSNIANSFYKSESEQVNNWQEITEDIEDNDFNVDFEDIDEIHRLRDQIKQAELKFANQNLDDEGSDLDSDVTTSKSTTKTKKATKSKKTTKANKDKTTKSTATKTTKKSSKTNKTTYSKTNSESEATEPPKLSLFEAFQQIAKGLDATTDETFSSYEDDVADNDTDDKQDSFSSYHNYLNDDYDDDFDDDNNDDDDSDYYYDDDDDFDLNLNNFDFGDIEIDDVNIDDMDLEDLKNFDIHNFEEFTIEEVEEVEKIDSEKSSSYDYRPRKHHSSSYSSSSYDLITDDELAEFQKVYAKDLEELDAIYKLYNQNYTKDKFKQSTQKLAKVQQAAKNKTNPVQKLLSSLTQNDASYDQTAEHNSDSTDDYDNLVEKLTEFTESEEFKQIKDEDAKFIDFASAMDEDSFAKMAFTMSAMIEQEFNKNETLTTINHQAIDQSTASALPEINNSIEVNDEVSIINTTDIIENDFIETNLDNANFITDHLASDMHIEVNDSLNIANTKHLTTDYTDHLVDTLEIDYDGSIANSTCLSPAIIKSTNLLAHASAPMLKAITAMIANLEQLKAKQIQTNSPEFNDAYQLISNLASLVEKHEQGYSIDLDNMHNLPFNANYAKDIIAYLVKTNPQLLQPVLKLKPATSNNTNASVEIVAINDSDNIKTHMLPASITVDSNTVSELPAIDYLTSQELLYHWTKEKTNELISSGEFRAPVKRLMVLLHFQLANDLLILNHVDTSQSLNLLHLNTKPSINTAIVPLASNYTLESSNHTHGLGLDTDLLSHNQRVLAKLEHENTNYKVNLSGGFGFDLDKENYHSSYNQTTTVKPLPCSLLSSYLATNLVPEFSQVHTSNQQLVTNYNEPTKPTNEILPSKLLQQEVNTLRSLQLETQSNHVVTSLSSTSTLSLPASKPTTVTSVDQANQPKVRSKLKVKFKTRTKARGEDITPNTGKGRIKTVKKAKTTSKTDQ